MTAMTEITALLENPENSSFVSMMGSMPGTSVVRPKSTIMQMAAISTRSTSNANRKIVVASMPMTRIISKLSVTVSISRLSKEAGW